jgi:cell surface protein SprA
MKLLGKYIIIVSVFISTGGLFSLYANLSPIYTEVPEITLLVAPEDTVTPVFPVAKIIPQEYKDLTRTYPVDLKTPVNLDPGFQYNPQTNRYEYRPKIGDADVGTPLTLTPEEYYKYSMQKSMDSYYRNKYSEEFLNNNQDGKEGKDKEALSMFDFKFDLGPAEKIFGPGGVKLSANGSILTKMGITRTNNGNPTLSERQKNRTAFDFDSQIQADFQASVGDKLNFDLNYNTESTFDYDTRKLKLGYVGKEDEIVKVLEAGNVSMNTTNSLIRGGAALFGIKTELQFGKLTVGAIFSQQESQSRSVSSKGNIQTTPFEVTADMFDENMHYFLGHFFYDNYDEALTSLPYIKSGINIDRIEVWITNKRSNYNESRNIVAFADLAEHDRISNGGFTQPTGSETIPSNNANNLFSNIVNNYPDARDISSVNQILGTTLLEGGFDYEKIENARKLEPSEYQFNPQLGYISLRTKLQPDEVLAVAYSYTYRGVTFQVGEFSTNNPNNPNDNLYVKLLKGTAVSPSHPTWKLMMRNIYPITDFNRNLEKDKFRLDIKYQSDTTGVFLNYITEGNIANVPLLQVENLDRLDSRNEPHRDGFFDFVEGYTVVSQTGKIIFPVVEPFGSHLRKKIGNNAIADKYVFQELYDSTLTVARQAAEKNKFILQGEYKGSGGNTIGLEGGNIARGSVTVTANGTVLKEGTDYTMDYSSGNVTIINPAYENANINVSSENQSSFGMQRKTMMGVNMNYAFNPNFNIGATVMNLSEMPNKMKTLPGEESINNTLFGFNTNYTTQSQLLTNWLDKIPLLDLTAPSQITLSAEYAQMIPGHYKSKYGGDFSYIDDFEQAKTSIDLRYPYAWNLSATPAMFDEHRLVNNIDYGKNRSLLAWYTIDGLFTRKSSLTPTHIKNDLDQLSNHYVREILESELFPDRDQRFNESPTIPVLNLAYYPQDRGPYNLDFDQMNTNGKLTNPADRWGGITRRMETSQTDFEALNIETLEFWLMDPFIYNPNGQGGDLYFNLGEVSEDILKDEKKFFENGLPIDGDTSKVIQTNWGVVPKQQSLVYAFDNSKGARRLQDVGFDGLIDEAEASHPSYSNYVEHLRQKLSPDVLAGMMNDPFSPLNDPAGDNYHYFRGSDFDQVEASILERYKHYNGVEGNSADAADSRENYNTAARLTPDVEDLNQDNTLNESEKYFQYKVSLRPQDLKNVGENYITQKVEHTLKLKNGKTETVTWYQFKIPIKECTDKVGNINDFKSIRFMRMFLTNFSDSVVLRLGTLELLYGDWRVYTKDLSNPNLPPPPGIGTSISLSTVNVEENSGKEPVNYVMPPGVNRILDPGQPQLRQQNEQSILAKITNLAPGDARAIYKSSGLDSRQYRRLQMFAHAEKLAEDLTDLQDNDLSIFIRLGSDYKNNYYEYEVPVKITPPGRYDTYSTTARETVWPASNMFDFPLELLTNLKLIRDKEKRKGGSDVTYYTPFSDYDPDKPMNKVTIVGKPSISDIKVVMIGIRNNSRSAKSAEIWADELRLTEFNEDGGWAGNMNLFVGLSDWGSVNFTGKKETAGFGSLDQGIMDRNLDDKHQINVAAQFDLGRFFPEKTKVKIPFYYSYMEDVVSPKYNPLDQDVLLKDALDAVETKAEKDSIKGFALDKQTTRSINFNSVSVDVRSKKPMPYDPANITISYSFVENNLQNATTEYERTTESALNINYAYSPPFKPWQPFKSNGKNTNGKPGSQSANQGQKPQNSKAANAASNGNASNGGSLKKFLQDIEIGYLPKALRFNSDLYRNYFELQLRDLANLGENNIPVSFRDDFYWNRTTEIQWNLTKNLNLNFNSGTNARIESPYVQANKKLNPDDYSLWKDSVLQSIRDLGTPMEYKQTFTATYAIPFKNIPILDFITANLKYNSGYKWQRGATIEIEDVEIGNVINSTRDIGLDNVMINMLNLYNKSKFLEEVNKKYTPKKTTAATGRNARKTPGQQRTADPAAEKRKKKFEKEISLSLDSTTVVAHQLDNKRLRITARGANGKLYQIKYKTLDNNSIQIKNKDSVNLKLSISQLPPIDETLWYKIAQGTARELMMVRSIGFSYNQGSEMMIPNFTPEVGNFLGQGSTPFGSAPGFDFAFGLANEKYLEKADRNNWLRKNEDNIVPAMFNKTETFTFTAVVEPIVGMRINLNATRTNTNRNQTYFMYDDMPTKFTGDFKMSTISIGSAFEPTNAERGYYSKTFDRFLENRDIIAGRLERIYRSSGGYPSSGFLAGSGYAGKPYDPAVGGVDPNSTDVLIPAFIAAYTGKNPHTIALTAFPSLKNLLPNWDVTYDGLLQIPLINKRFKSFKIEHRYSSIYAVGAFNSFLGWVASDIDGIGFIQNITSNRPYPSSPFDITAVSITEAFNPLIGVNSTLLNNLSFSLKYNSTRNVNLNMSAYQVVETNKGDIVFSTGYLFDNFNRILGIKKTGGPNFNNEFRLKAEISFNETKTLIRKIQDNFTQATAGDKRTSISLSGDYSLSKLITLQAFYDRLVSQPLVSSTAYPTAKSSFGVSVKVSLSR